LLSGSLTGTAATCEYLALPKGSHATHFAQ
jgi:hypothetical protein